MLGTDWTLHCVRERERERVGDSDYVRKLVLIFYHSATRHFISAYSYGENIMLSCCRYYLVQIKILVLLVNLMKIFGSEPAHELQNVRKLETK